MTAEAAVKEEKQTNCPACNKVLRRIRRYYRNGTFYCTKRCWAKAIEKAKGEGDAES